MLPSENIAPESTVLRAKIAGLRLLAAALRFQHLLRKANFNPGQLRIPVGQPGGGQWTDDGGNAQPVADKLPPLRRLHPDATYDTDQIAKGALDYWRRQSTDKIVDSLKAGAKQPLTVKPDGTIAQGNTRIKVLQERAYDVDSLPRAPHDDSSPQPQPRRRRGGGAKPPGGRFPRI